MAVKYGNGDWGFFHPALSPVIIHTKNSKKLPSPVQTIPRKCNEVRSFDQLDVCAICLDSIDEMLTDKRSVVQMECCGKIFCRKCHVAVRKVYRQCATCCTALHKHSAIRVKIKPK